MAYGDNRGTEMKFKQTKNNIFKRKIIEGIPPLRFSYCNIF